MADLPKINPVNIVMESEKYYDFDPGGFQRALPTLKTVGGGIADILLPQDATDVAMMTVPPLAIFKRVKKILREADSLDYQAMSSYNSYMRFGDDIDLKTYNEKKSRADGLRKSISKEDKKIHDDYEKSLMGTKEDFDRNIAELRESLRKKFSEGDEVTKEDQPNFFFDTVRNVPSSAYQFGSDVAQAVTNPVQTLDAIGNLGLGLIALAIPDAYQEERLDKPQEAAMAVGKYISDRYGGLDKAKESLRTDPVGVLADVSGILLGGGYLATKSGLLKAGDIATKAGIATDPLVIAGKGASQVGKGITRRDVLKGTGAGLASLAVPMSMVTDVTKSIPPVAKSSGALAGIGKFRGIIDNLEPFLIGSKKRQNIKSDYGTGKSSDKITYEDYTNFYEKYPEIGYNKSAGIIPNQNLLNDDIRNFQKIHNLETEDFTFINQNTMMRPKENYKDISSSIIDAKQIKNTTDTIDSVEDIFNKLDNAPDKKVTVKKLGMREYRLTTGTVEGVPIMKNEIYTDKHGGVKVGGTLYMPNKSGLEKLSKSKPKLAKGGSVDKPLYADQKYI